MVKTLQDIGVQAKRMMASGALWFAKSDVVSNLFRIECKTKAKPSKQITFKKEWLDKIELEAFQTGKMGIVAFSFGDGKDYIAQNADDYFAMVKELIQLRERCGENEKT